MDMLTYVVWMGTDYENVLDFGGTEVSLVDFDDNLAGLDVDALFIHA